MLDILSDLVRGFGFAIDNVIYSLITIVYKLFIYLSEVNLFSMDDSTPLGKLISRIYVFLGIFMLFKVSFSLIQYLIDPNSFSDKSKGFGKLVTNALVTMILLVSTPYIFTFAMNLQTTIITSNAIGKLILGDTTGNTVIEYEEDENGNRVTKAIDTYTAGEMATDVQFLVYGAFFSINPNAKLNGEDLVDGKNKCATSPVFGTIEMAKNENGCLSALQSEFENSNNDMAKYNVQLTDFFKIANSNGEIDKSHQRNFENFGKLLSWRDDTNQYVINYLPFVSAAAGIYIVFLLVTFSIDIAVRAIKLCFLEMIAPIAIVSYIDPKESISNSKLRNWIKESATTYFSLFLRLATIFLVMVLISTIASSVLAAGGPISEQINNMEAGYNIWIYLFLIIGSFVFAKKVPQMIENIFGIKMSGEMSLNPFKNAGIGIGGAMLAGGAAFAGAGAANAIAAGAQGISNIKEIQSAGSGNRLRAFSGIDEKRWNEMGKLGHGWAAIKTGFKGSGHAMFGLGSIAGGAISGGTRAVSKGETKGIRDIGKNAIDAMNAVKQARIERDAKTSQTVGTRIGNKVTDFAGIKNQFGGYGKLDAQFKHAQEELQGVQQVQNRFRDNKADTIIDIAKKNPLINSTALESLNTSQYLEKAQREILDREANSGKSTEEILQDHYNDIMANAYSAYQHEAGVESINEADFRTLTNINSNIETTVKREKELQNEIRTIKESMGKKEDKK